MRVGTLAWARQTDGLLRPRDRVRLLGQALLVQLNAVPAELRHALGLKQSRLARLEPEDLRAPDSLAAKQAERVCAELTSPVVDNHSRRSYLWGAILARHDGIAFDEELLYVASLLHDLGWEHPPAGRCFTTIGAERALSLAHENDWDQRRAEAAAEAITLHLNLWVGVKQGIEAHLLTAGSRLDAAGLRYWELAPETVNGVLDRFPRLGLKRAFCRSIADQAAAAPGSRSHFYTRYLAGRRFIERSPFDD